MFDWLVKDFFLLTVHLQDSIICLCFIRDVEQHQDYLKSYNLISLGLGATGTEITVLFTSGKSRGTKVIKEKYLITFKSHSDLFHGGNLVESNMSSVYKTSSFMLVWTLNGTNAPEKHAALLPWSTYLNFKTPGWSYIVASLPCFHLYKTWPFQKTHFNKNTLVMVKHCKSHMWFRFLPIFELRIF